MKKNRYIPFGYRIENGEIVLCEPEAETVKLIYSEYMHGHSLKDIAEQMTHRGIHYSEASPIWNKHMVKRILDNRKYIGSEECPALITQDEYDSVHHSKAGKYLRKDIHIPDALKIIKGKAFCYECGRPFTRLHDRRISPKWHCRDNDCKTDLKITDEMLLDGVTMVLNQIIANPDIIQSMSTTAKAYSIEAARIQNEINRELSKTEPNVEHVKMLLMTCASEKYANCVDDIHSDNLYATFDEHHLLTEFDIQLFAQTVETIQITKKGAVYLQLRNQQTLTASDICEKGNKYGYRENCNGNPTDSHLAPRTAKEA